MKCLMALTLAIAGVVLVPTAAQAGAPGAIFACQFTGQTANVDPIVSPGQVSEHPHIFYGAHPVDMTETSADLRTKPTTCAEPGNRSAYWMPQVKENGVVVPPGTSAHMLAYYKCKTTPCSAVQPFPENFGMVQGNVNATSPSQNPAFTNGLGGYRCGTGGGAFSPNPPTTCSSGIMVVSLTFGDCIVGGAVITDSTCAGTPVPRIQLYFRFNVGAGSVGNITIGGHAPVSLHADFFFGWDRTTFNNFLNECIRVNRDCGKNPSL